MIALPGAGPGGGCNRYQKQSTKPIGYLGLPGVFLKIRGKIPVENRLPLLAAHSPAML